MTKPAPTAMRYAAFISYSHSNEREAGRLHRVLESFRIPKDIAAPDGFPCAHGRMAPIFRDREELSSSSDLSASIRAALEQSCALIVVCSPNARKSRWVNEEIKAFKRLHGEARVFAFLIEGEPAEAFPEALLRTIGPDGELSTTGVEPLAADIRPGKDGWKIGAMKIAAGLLGVGLDALRQRELARERGRMMAWTGGSIAVAATSLGLMTWAILASMTADKMRARAEKEALTATRTADFMVDLFEVPDPGESRGRAVTAREILDKGVARIENGLKDEPAVQGDLMHTMGRVYTGLGFYPEAARILAVARVKRAQTVADPADLYATENALARALFEKGDLEGAMKIYEKLVAEAETAIARGERRVEYAVAMTGMGEVVYYFDKPAEAQPFYERARDLLAQNGLSQSEEMAAALQGLAGALLDQGNLTGAEGALLEANNVYEKQNTRDNYRAIGIKSDLAAVFYSEGRIRDAATVAEDVYAENHRILGARHPNTLVSANNLARYKFESGELKAAHDLIQTVVKLFIETGRDQDFSFIFPVNSAAEIQLELGAVQPALDGFREALGLAKDRSNRMYAPINLNLGRSLCAYGDTGQGMNHVQIGRAALKDHYEPEDWRYAAADEFESRCRSAMGDAEAARTLAKSAYGRFHEKLGDEHFFTQRSKKWLEGLG